ncbi:hypothetical protein [Phytomonospora endophytica]|uniref:Uncharacterized protein n=1 Tax=Phytomonospora endophytica TaxID=714109 RepID=A0A841FI36_9ACTN|nr:hypothetical protein [Phytomonospora endophytica]MBB6032777.1 hypothetical protein [Phytomonospora endophytica]
MGFFTAAFFVATVFLAGVPPVAFAAGIFALSGGVLVGVDFALAFVARDDDGEAVAAPAEVGFSAVDVWADLAAVFFAADRPVAALATFFCVAVPDFRSPMAAPRQV